jgi:hypothetical protein
MKIRKNKKIFSKGFSLLEVIIYVSIFGIFIVTILSFFSFVNTLSLRNKIYNDINREGKQIVNIITSEIKQANSIISPIQTESANSLTMSFSNGNRTLYINNGILFENVASQEIDLSSENFVISDLFFYNFSNDETAGNIHFNFKISNLTKITAEKVYEINFTGGASLK